MVDELLKMITECHLQKPQTTSEYHLIQKEGGGQNLTVSFTIILIFIPALPEGSFNGGTSEEVSKRDETKGLKRPLNPSNNDNDSDDDEKRVVPPVNDIYRLRQQKRVAF